MGGSGHVGRLRPKAGSRDVVDCLDIWIVLVLMPLLYIVVSLVFWLRGWLVSWFAGDGDGFVPEYS